MSPGTGQPIAFHDGRYTFTDGATYEGGWAYNAENGDGTFFFPATKGQPRTSMCCQWKNGSPTTAKARLELDDGTVLAGKVAVARFRELERSCSRAEVRPCGRLRSVA